MIHCYINEGCNQSKLLWGESGAPDRVFGEILHQYTHKSLWIIHGHFNCKVHRPKLIVILKHIELVKNWWYPERSTLQNTLTRDATHLLGWSMGSSIAAACASLTNHHIERGVCNGRRAKMTHVIVWVEPW